MNIKKNKSISNNALHGIGVKLPRDFRFIHAFSIHALCSGARPPRELGRCGEIENNKRYRLLGSISVENISRGNDNIKGIIGAQALSGSPEANTAMECFGLD